MAMPNGFEIHLTEDPDNPGEVLAGVVANRAVSDLVQAIVFVRDAGATFQATVEASISSDIWDAVGTLDMTKQFIIPAEYHRVRVNVTTPGVLGSDHSLFYYGKS
jgi:hypothetical protein